MSVVQFLLAHGYFVYLAALALAGIGYLLLVITAFRTRLGWGLGTLLFPPVGLAYLALHTRRAVIPLCLFFLSIVLLGATYAAHYFHNVDLGPREKLVDGELHITLTGWDRIDYVILAAKPETTVLQMANEDVNDHTLELIKGMKQLRELDLNYTQVSDIGLQTLGQLPRLSILRLRNTNVTDAGFQAHLLNAGSILELDVRGTAVAAESLREWKAKNSDKRKCLPRLKPEHGP